MILVQVLGFGRLHGSRKIYAVATGDLKKFGHTADSSSSDNELEPPKKKLVYSDIDKNIKALRNQVDSLLEVQGTLRLPLSLRKLLLENFKCIVCRSVMKPPVIFARCCKRIVGCESCVDTWYRGAQSEGNLSQTCPQCRSERAYADTCRINGLDDFLQGIGRMISTAELDSD